MKTNLSITLVLTLALAMVNEEILLAQKQPIAQVIESQGMKVKREQSSEYKDIKVRENLYLGDLLRVPKGGKGVIQCTNNSTTWTVPDDDLPRGVANTCSPRKS